MSVDFGAVRVGVASGAILHPTDFVFSRSKEELAARVQPVVYGDGPQEPERQARVSIDEEGDLVVEEPGSGGMAQRYLYLLESQVNFRLANVPLGTLVGAESDFARYVDLLWRLFLLRELPAPDWFGIRVVLALPFTEPAAGELMRRHYLGPILSSLATEARVAPEPECQCSLQLLIDGITYGVLVASDREQRAIVVSVDGGGAPEELSDSSYPAFAERTAPRVVQILARIVEPLLPDPRLDAEFLSTGRQRSHEQDE